MSPLLIIVILVLVFGVGWGSFGYPRWRGPNDIPGQGPYWVGGYAPLGGILLLLLLLYLFGVIRLH